MSFFGKIKQGLGIGTASVQLQVPDRVEKESGTILGDFTVTAKSDQKVKSVKVKLVERYTTGRGEEQKTKEYVLGEIDAIGEPFDLAKDGSRKVQFSLPFSLKQSSAQSMAEKGGALGMLGKAAVMASNERSEFFVKAVCDLEGVALDPVDSKRIQLN